MKDRGEPMTKKTLSWQSLDEPGRTRVHGHPGRARIGGCPIASTRFAAALLPALATLLLVVGCARPAGQLRPARLHAAGLEVLELPLSAETLASLLTIDGGEVSAVRFDDGSVVLKGNGQQLLVFLEDDGTSLQAVLPYFGPLPGELEALAAWNAGRRFGRAYLDDEGGPILASDLLLVEGMPAAAVRTWGRLLISMAEAFRAEVWPGSAP